MEFGTDFFAKVVLNSGGHIARLIANLMQTTLDQFTSIRISKNLALCYDSPAYFSYLISFLFFCIGYNSYRVDELCKNMQEELKLLLLCNRKKGS